MDFKGCANIMIGWMIDPETAGPGALPSNAYILFYVGFNEVDAGP